VTVHQVVQYSIGIFLILSDTPLHGKIKFTRW
jgi:hypothetical protein